MKALLFALVAIVGLMFVVNVEAKPHKNHKRPDARRYEHRSRSYPNYYHPNYYRYRDLDAFYYRYPYTRYQRCYPAPYDPYGRRLIWDTRRGSFYFSF